MANVFDVATYILDKLETVTTMKLQKLVYYCQAWSLVWDDEPIISNEFEAWINGPVCRELYNEHKHKYRVEKGEFDYKKSNEELTKIQKETIDAVLDFYGDREPHYLIELTHKEDPWRLARGDCKDGDYCKNIITKESMLKYYGGL